MGFVSSTSWSDFDDHRPDWLSRLESIPQSMTEASLSGVPGIWTGFFPW
jgi:hypothetical protein